MDDMITFHSGEQEELHDTTKKIELETTINLLLEIGGKTLLEKIVATSKLKTSQEPILNPIENQAF